MYLKAIINFLDACNSMLEVIADYESEMKINAEWTRAERFY